MPLPDPSQRNPIQLPDGSRHAGTVLLNRAISHPNFSIGDYSYASAFEAPEDWAQRLAPYLYPGSREKIVIGRFCQIAEGVRFITASANHAQEGISCYPFPVFDQRQMAGFQPDTRDTIVGHDVWIGYGALILPGARIELRIMFEDLLTRDVTLERTGDIDYLRSNFVHGIKRMPVRVV